MRSWSNRTAIFAACAVVVLLGLLYKLAWDTRPSQVYDNQECAPYSQTAKDIIHITPPVSKLEANNSNNHIENHQAKSGDFERIIACRDLAAQWSMADITWYAYFAGLAGIFLVIVSIWATQEANDIQKKQLRAYLGIEEIKGILPRPSLTYKGQPKSCTTVHFVNTGQTRAIIISLEHRWIELVSDEAKEKFAGSDNIKDRIVEGYAPTQINKTMIAQGMKFRCLIPHLSKLGNSIAKNGHVNTYLDIRCRYKDIYGKVWEGNYLLESVRLNCPEEVHATEHQIT